MGLSEAFPASPSCGVRWGLHLGGRVREERRRSLCLFTFACFSLLFLFSTLCTFLRPCLKWMTSLCKHGRWCLRLEKAELWDGGRWVFLSAEASDVLFRATGIVWHLQLPLTQEWLASQQIRTRKYGSIVSVREKVVSIQYYFESSLFWNPKKIFKSGRWCRGRWCSCIHFRMCPTYSSCYM